MFEEMRTFVRIAEMESITQAARSLGISLTMASRHLRWLEGELGTALVRRTTRQLHLTDAGREFAARARALVAGVDEARQALRPGPKSLVGRVVIAAPNALGTCQLSSVLSTFSKAHPNLRVEFRLEDRAVDLVKEGVDLAIRTAAPPDRTSLVAREVAKFHCVVCAAPGFLARYGPIDSLEALAAAPCIIHGRGPATWKFETSEGLRAIKVDGPLCTNSGIIIRDQLLAGTGIAWLPNYVIHADLRDGRLVRLLPEAKLPPVSVFGVMPKQARQNATVRAVFDCLSAALRATAAEFTD